MVGHICRFLHKSFEARVAGQRGFNQITFVNIFYGQCISANGTVNFPPTQCIKDGVSGLKKEFQDRSRLQGCASMDFTNTHPASLANTLDSHLFNSYFLAALITFIRTELFCHANSHYRLSMMRTLFSSL